MKHQALCNDILASVGGKKNINEVSHCMTRLRINVNSMDKVDINQLEAIAGIIGAVKKGDQVQIVIGNEINNVYNDFMELVGETKQNASTKKDGNAFERALNAISGIFNPIVPALAGAGMIKVLLVILKLTNILPVTSETYVILNTVSDSVFTFLPFLLAFTAAKKFRCNPFVAVALAGALMHPTFTTMMQSGTASLSFLGISVKLMSYSSTVLPIILGVWFMSYVEKLADKIMPSALKIVMVPALTLLISAPIVMMTIGPVANYLGNLLAQGVEVLFDKGGIFAGMIYGGIYSAMVVTGLHQGMVPVLVSSITTYGYNTISPASGSANMGQAGAAFAVWLKSKHMKTKAVAAGACVSACLGVTEPAIYGVNLRLKRPFLFAAIGGAAGGAFAAAFGCRAYVMGGPSFLTIPMFIGDDGNRWVFVLIAFIIAFTVAAVLTYLFGFEEIPLDEEDKGKEAPKEISADTMREAVSIQAPVSGEVVPLRDVPDATFANGMIGHGFAIEPSDPSIYAPVSGTVTTLFKTGHAIGITTAEGVEVLVHIGIDTVKLEGNYFQTCIQQNDQIQAGDLMVKVDLEGIRAKGYSAMTMVVVTNSLQFPKMKLLDHVQAFHGDAMMLAGK